MKYEKPQVVVLASATAAIQHGIKDPSNTTDSTLVETVGAYEADE
ncbi:MAG: hypothetical protein WAN72_18870 [Candidatus Acidiferrales bacterium]